MKNKLYVALVHYPVLNKHNEVVTTSITNLDIHDISRSCSTFGVEKFFLVTPLESQKELYQRILGFWKSDIANKYNPDRVKALSLIEFAKSIEDAYAYVTKQEGVEPYVVTTTAAKMKSQLEFNEVKQLDRPALLIFGTGNGLTKDIHSDADFILVPIKGAGVYNHLSVRSAVAIVLDRLTSEK